MGGGEDRRRFDGKLVTPPDDDRWLTSPQARLAAHELRWESDAILIGAETVRILTTHNSPSACPVAKACIQPWRIPITRSAVNCRQTTLHLFSDAHREHTRLSQSAVLGEFLADLGNREISCTS